MAPQTLLAVPNVSEGRDAAAIAEIGRAFARTRASGAHEQDAQVRLLDTHSDPDHHRSVFTLAGRPGALSSALVAGAKATLAHVDLSQRDPDVLEQAGRHPHVGALDVVPLVYLEEAAKGAACAEALVTAERLGSELAIPVFLYGELTGLDPATHRTRAELRRSGRAGLAERVARKELIPDFGPRRALHPRAGATLVAARPPLVAFNLVLAPPATVGDAKVIAAQLREDGLHGIKGLRAIGVELSNPSRPQLSMNVEDPLRTPLAMIIRAVQGRAHVDSAELVGLAPRAAFDGFPDDVPISGFDPERHLIENRLGSF